MLFSVRKTALATVFGAAMLTPLSLASAQPADSPTPSQPPAAKPTADESSKAEVRGTESRGAESRGAESRGAESRGAESPKADAPAPERTTDPDEKPESPPDQASKDSPLPNKLGEEQLAQVRKNYQAGQAKLDEQDYAGALPLFQRADAIAQVPTTRLQVARCLEGLGRLIDARQKARSVAALPRAAEPNPNFEKARALAVELVKKRDKRVAHLKVTILPATGSATVDGVEVSASKRRDLELDPGKHTLKVNAPAHLEGVEPFELAEGETKIITITLAPHSAAATPPSSQLTADAAGPTFGPITAIGTVVGGLGILTGAIAGGIALERAAPIREKCNFGDGNDCVGMQADLDAANLAAHVSTAGVVLAGVGLGTALLGAFVFDKPDSAQASDSGVALRPLLGPGYAGLAGRF